MTPQLAARSSPGRTRDISLDSARGVAIIGVVINHVVRGIRDAGLGGQYDGFIHQLDFAFYLPELVLFAFVSGLFVPQSVARAGSGPYLRKRLANLVYLYLVWTLIQGTVEVLSSSVKNAPTTWAQVAQIWNPLGHLWFLPWLAIATVVTVVARPWDQRLTWRVGITVVTVIVSIATWGLNGPAFYQQGIGLTMFMVLGAGITREQWQRLLAKSPAVPLAVGGVVLLAGYVVLQMLPNVTLPTASDPSRTVLSVAIGIALASIACAGVLATCTATARAVAPSPIDRGLAYLGRQSLPVYVSHIIFAAGIRVIMIRVGVTKPLILLLVGLAVGIAGPLILERVSRKFPLLFKPPWELELQRSSTNA